MSGKTVWEIVDNDFTDVACVDCAHDFVVERGFEHVLGNNFSNEEADVHISEDIYGNHGSDCDHVCQCGVVLGDGEDD
jgi:hypothetical protein